MHYEPCLALSHLSFGAAFHNYKNESINKKPASKVKSNIDKIPNILNTKFKINTIDKIKAKTEIFKKEMHVNENIMSRLKHDVHSAQVKNDEILKYLQ